MNDGDFVSSPETLLEHAESSVFQGSLDDPTHSSTRRNPHCGDQITLDLSILGERIESVRFRGKGCVVSRAGASLLCELIDKRSIAELRSLQPDDVLSCFGFPLSPLRRVCAVLALQCVDEVLGKFPDDSGKATPIPVTRLKNKHRGEDAWVIAAGPSMGFVEPDFFEGKWTIGVNYTHRRFPCRYVVGKEVRADAFAPKSHTLIVSRHGHGNLRRPETTFPGPGEYYVFDHVQNRKKRVDWSVLGTDKIVVSYSTITSAMHVAAYMGAANIMLCGTDGGMLDGNIVYEGYYPNMPPRKRAQYREFVQTIKAQTVELRDRLLEVYGCRVYMLNPFVNFDFEGHLFEP